MVKVFITGSSDGIGLSAAQRLISQGHSVVLHARNAQRALDTQKAAPGALSVVVADLRSLAAIKQLATDADALGPYDAIIHNAGIGYGTTSSAEVTSDGVSAVFSVNTLAPYVLTCLMQRPRDRILFMSSDSSYGGDPSLRNASRSTSYSDSKLHDVMLANAFARRWDGTTGVQVLSMHPGWVRTKMGGSHAPGSVDKPTRALAAWAAGEGVLAGMKSGSMVDAEGEIRQARGAGVVEKQEELMGICEKVSGVSVPNQ
jgi:NAD(P)-dependent dehydrogenase (short-subunit alcohol dehydrogenase family)